VKQSLQENIYIFIADEMHRHGIDILNHIGYKVVEIYGLDNDNLLKSIARMRKEVNQRSVLIIRSVRRIDRDLIDRIYKYTTVALICTASSGFDNIDSAYSIKKGISVLNVPEGNFVSAAEHTIALILSIFKNINHADEDMKKGIFDAGRYVNSELLGKTIGIVGVGRVGSYVANLARSFGMKILGNDINRSLFNKYRWIKFVSLDHLIRSSDIITLHTPLDRSTLNLINKNNIKSVKKGTLLINCARGGIVNERALIAALKRNKLYYGGVDVFVNEPDILYEFRKLKNIVLTPHLAGKTKESKVRISVQLAEGIIDYFSSERYKSKNSTLKN
jgi:D-3-phosphoglycerate dehydrogenase